MILQRRHLNVRIRLLTLLAGALTAIFTGLALSPSAEARHDHRLVYVFVLDALDGDTVDQGKLPFLSSMLAGQGGANGTYFPNSKSMMVAETNPNHVSMATGASPYITGITGNEFGVYGPIPDEDSCPAPGTRDPGAAAATSGESAECIKAQTIFTSIERQRNPSHLTTALIMGKPKLGRLLATQRVHPDERDPDYTWAPCESPSDSTPYCDQVPINPVTRYAVSDAVVMDEVIRTTQERVADEGKLRLPDFTFANFPQIDSAGHAFGRGSAYDEAATLADMEIQRFVANQKSLGLWERTTVIVVSDHSMDSTPQLAKVSLADAFDAAGVPEDRYVIVGNGSAAHIYLANRRDPDRFELLKQMREAMVAVPAVDNAWYRVANPVDGNKAKTLKNRRPGWALRGPRTGDLVVTVGPGIAVYEMSDASSYPFNPLPGNHGGVHTRDNTWAIFGGLDAIQQGVSPDRVYNRDVAVTAAKLLSSKPPRKADGRIARAAFDIAALKK